MNAKTFTAIAAITTSTLYDDPGLDIFWTIDGQGDHLDWTPAPADQITPAVIEDDEEIEPAQWDLDYADDMLHEQGWRRVSDWEFDAQSTQAFTADIEKA